MFAYLKGKLTFKSPTMVYLETNGVGYEVHISLTTYTKIEELEETQLWTHFVVREDSQTLYGFFEQAERSMFIHLISVSGIGPNTGRLILSSMNYSEVQRAIANESVASLNKIKGVGPKTAKRIILDLKEKMVKESLDGDNLPNIVSNTAKDDALSALLALGFQKHKVSRILNDSYKDGISVEELIKIVLSQVSK